MSAGVWSTDCSIQDTRWLPRIGARGRVIFLYRTILAIFGT